MKYWQAWSLALAFAVTACGGTKTPEPTVASATPSAPDGGASEDDEEANASTKTAVAAANASAPSQPGDDKPVPMEVLLTKPTPGAAKDFPKKATSDKGCEREVLLTGKFDADYEALIAKCGGPTGMKPYVTKVVGRFDDKHPRHAYAFKMLGGFCYRFFAVADATVKNINVRVQRPLGALVSIDQSKSPVAIMDPDEPWCKKHDRDFTLIVETSSGAGQFAFGVWARPK